MKTTFKVLLCFCVLLIVVAFVQTPKKPGIYTGKSQASYTDEPYVGKVEITVENQRVVFVNFVITDTVKHEVFTSEYAKHYPDNKVYQDQCKSDWVGVQEYPKRLLKQQKLEGVDAISGATWSYNIFKSAAEKALKSEPMPAR